MEFAISQMAVSRLWAPRAIWLPTLACVVRQVMRAMKMASVGCRVLRAILEHHSSEDPVQTRRGSPLSVPTSASPVSFQLSFFTVLGSKGHGIVESEQCIIEV